MYFKINISGYVFLCLCFVVSIVGGDNIFQEEYTSHTHERTNESTQSTPRNARSYIFDLNQSPRFDLNEPPPSEHPSPPHTQGKIYNLSSSNCL